MLAEEQIYSGLLAVLLAKKLDLRVPEFSVKVALAVLNGLIELLLRGVDSVLLLLRGLAPDDR